MSKNKKPKKYVHIPNQETFSSSRSWNINLEGIRQENLLRKQNQKISQIKGTKNK